MRMLVLTWGLLFAELLGPQLRSAAQDAATTRVIERAVTLSSTVSITRAEQIGGAGRVRAPVVIAGVRAIVPRILLCFDPVPGGRVGDLTLVFTVTASGRVTRVEIGGDTLGDSYASRCIRSTAQILRFTEGAQGGEARLAYILHRGR